MIVEVVAGEISEDATGKLESVDTVLHASVRTHLHEGIFTSCLHHLVQETVEGEVVGGGLLSGLHALVDDVAHRREQSRLESHEIGKLIKQSGDGCLAIGAGNAHELELRRGIVIPCACQVGKGDVAVLHQHIGDMLAGSAGQLLTHHRCGTILRHLRQELVGIDAHTPHSHKEAPLFHCS